MGSNNSAANWACNYYATNKLVDWSIFQCFVELFTFLIAHMLLLKVGHQGFSVLRFFTY